MIGLKFFSVVSLVAVCFVSTIHAQMTMDQYSQADDSFKKNFEITDKGIVQFMSGRNAPKSITTSMSDNNSVKAYKVQSNGTIDWSVGSQPCSQNKEFNCLGIYNRSNTIEKGNKQNPFGKEYRTGDYTLYRINSKNPKESSVVSCSDTSLLINTAIDDANLKNCVQYSQPACDAWFKAVAEDPTLGSSLFENEQYCKDLLSKGDKLRAKMNTIFQSDLKSISKDISINFNNITNVDKTAHIDSNVQIPENNSSPVIANKSVLLITDALERSKACKKYESIFDGSNSAKSKMARILNSYDDSATSTNSSESKVKKSKTKQ